MEHCKSCRNLNPDLAATGLWTFGAFPRHSGCQAPKEMWSVLSHGVPGSWTRQWLFSRDGLECCDCDRENQSVTDKQTTLHTPCTSHPSLSHSRGMATQSKVAIIKLSLKMRWSLFFGFSMDLLYCTLLWEMTLDRNYWHEWETVFLTFRFINLMCCTATTL